ncbi:MAG: ATP-binding protein [Muribaculaceae bacterium]|nr:ATP-binding protein [Muribaculaceae bacterium]
METQKYPIGIQTFSSIIEEGFTYVDKTGFIPALLKGRYYFLSRPRRFGKSLLLSTLHAYFEGRRDLFKGLALENADVDWEPSPVLHFDFNSEDFTQMEGLNHLLDSYLSYHEKIYGGGEKDASIPQRFRDLIRSAYEKTQRKVVILIDEYDKPLLGIEENGEVFEKNQSLLKGFFGNLKSMDRYIRFAFITGVARFNKVSIFSDLNNLYDISMTEEYADICGWTEKELVDNFRPGILRLAEAGEMSEEETLKALRGFYDGYLFAPKGSRLYNPFSVLLALQNREIAPYWFETGTPTFLARRIRERGVAMPSLNGIYRKRESLVAVGMNSADAVPLMFQTGYLTIESYDPRMRRMQLRFPNREVEIGFAMNLLPLYAPPTENQDGQFSIHKFQDDLFNGDPDAFMTRLATLLKDIPYGQHSEAAYQSITYILCLLCSLDSAIERHSYKGRSDLEVKTPDYIYIFEFKYNGSVEEAMQQIRERDYAGRYSLDTRTIYLIGANFSDKVPERGLTGYVIEKVNKTLH